MLNHEPPPNWVKGRAECNLSMMFEALAQIVERDVAEANKAIHGREFKFELCAEGVRPILRVEDRADSTGGVTISLAETDAIRVSGGGVQFYARPRWDGHRCRMYINDEDRCELWELSQAALSKFFFGP